MRASLRETARERLTDNAAVAAITCYGASTAVSVVEAAEAEGSPVVLLVPPSLPAAVEGLRTIRAMRAIADSAAVPVSVQLDHASDAAIIAVALEAGVDAVLADGSKLSHEDNAAFVRSIRRLAGPDLTLEAELGSILGHEDRALDLDPDTAGMTDPADVAGFVDQSGCDLLAVAVGNVHGRYRGRPLIDRDRLARIRVASAVPLVLHGASGLPREDLAAAGASGVGKVNVNTELRGVVLDAIETRLPQVRKDGDDVATLAQVRGTATRDLTTSILRRLAGARTA
ncbi:Fructose-bisphosphate aldolase class II (EC [Amycolatopsis camponoti]|uniref:Fructose-bisphosphate aldolase class II (EC) n=1 Tax=Amycolatopsis camponoti TaxID=2606593 RepID=A0A6I8LWR5_9PSEU|nr:class II fructose-bisphosphate aldolase [Amycolatopsis camponoti]VVJ21580.1 Fructose-bisphosphate aldolase class II (EC [Amycolatopsis camponoti]